VAGVGWGAEDRELVIRRFLRATRGTAAGEFAVLRGSLREVHMESQTQIGVIILPTLTNR